MSSVEIILLSIIAAMIPTIFYVAIIYWVDRYEKEPVWLLTAAFLWGAIPSIIIAFIFNSIFSIPVYLVAGEGAGDTFAASFIAPPVEESLKGIALLLIFFLWRDEIDSPLDGIIYGAMVGMGFAMVENVYYFVNVYNEGGAEAWGINIFIRAVIFGLNHALFSSATGLGIAVARMSTKPAVRGLAPVLGWMAAVFLHFLHNISVSVGSLLCLVALITDWGGVGLLLIIILWALLQERKWLKTYLVEEVKLGTLTLSQYQIASSGRKRLSHSMNILFSRGLRAYVNIVRFYRQSSELAYKKHHNALFQSEKSHQMVINTRNKMVDLGRLTL